MRLSAVTFFLLTVVIAASAIRADGVPVIRIDTKDGVEITRRSVYVNMDFSLTDPENPRNNVVKTGMADSIRGRGNWTWFDAPKNRIA